MREQIYLRNGKLGVITVGVAQLLSVRIGLFAVNKQKKNLSLHRLLYFVREKQF